MSVVSVTMFCVENQDVAFSKLIPFNWLLQTVFVEIIYYGKTKKFDIVIILAKKKRYDWCDGVVIAYLIGKVLVCTALLQVYSCCHKFLSIIWIIMFLFGASLNKGKV